MKGIPLHKIQELKQHIDSLKAKGYKKTYIEKALNLPFGTFDKWCSFQEIDPAGLVLLKILDLYPNMIDLADCDYDMEKYNEMSSMSK